MFRPFTILFVLLLMVLPARAGEKVGLTIPVPLTLPARPTSFATALPYVQFIHQVLDAATTRESPASIRAKVTGTETRSEWIVHHVKADIGVERTSNNYLGQIGVRVSIPCRIEFSLDLNAVRNCKASYDPTRRLLVLDLPPVTMRRPIPELAEMKIEPYYKGLRGVLLDAEKMRRLQEELMKQDYLPAAREAALNEHATAQRHARDLMQEFIQSSFRQAGIDIEVVVR